MQAQQKQFIQFIDTNSQFVIPLYQRTYSWTHAQCNQLWKDITRVAVDDVTPTHFIGSIVYITPGIHNIADTSVSQVIDGQQRLTTLSLIALALRDSIDGTEQTVTESQIEDYLLINRHAAEDKKVKLQLTKSDAIIFEKLVKKHELTDIERRSTVYKNISFFKKQITTGGVDIDTVYAGMRKLVIVDIALGPEDDPQLIFESLNSTGLDLSQSDLIRNYVLMGLEPEKQSDLYNNVWLPMENDFIQVKGIDKFDRFMRDYLTIKNGAIPNINAVYATFKMYIYGKDIKEVMEDVKKYAQYYLSLEFGKESDTSLKKVMQDIRTLKVDVAYPFLMQSYDDYANNTLSKEDFLQVLRLTESYVFRRSICGIPTNSLNKTFALLHKDINTEAYLESLGALFILKSGRYRYPDDVEFKKEIITKDIYNSRNSKYTLTKFETLNNAELVDLDNISIEHIMPQTLTAEWKDMLGDDYEPVHATYLHTLGNLTLTGYNSPMGNKSFAEKKEAGFINSGLQLNTKIASLEEWNKTEITGRAQELSGTALTIWEYPNLDEDTLERYRKDTQAIPQQEYTLDDYEYLQGGTEVLYKELKERILSLDSDIKEEYLKLYIAFKTSKTNFVDVVPQAGGLRLSLNMKYTDIDDPESKTKDITNIGRWGNGDVEVRVTTTEDIEYVMFLIKQAFEKRV